MRKSKMIEVHEMKRLMLDIMSSIDKYCRDNGIRYSMAYGTLLGAVRHKGYIPWDDDIDIWMPRPDYMRFMEYFKHPYYKAYCAEFSPRWDHFIAKVCDERTIIDEGHGDVCGVYVDIFPVDGWPDNEKLIKKHYSRVMRYLRLWSSLHYTQNMKLSLSQGFFKNIKIAASKILGLFFDSSHFLKEMLKTKTEYPYQTASKVGSLTCGDWAVPKYYFDKLIDLPFENRVFLASEQYDALLKVVFGNYMVLPPVEQRISNHGFTAYWK